MRGRDLSKTLDEKELRRLRNLLDQNPQITDVTSELADFPKMYFTATYLESERAWKDSIDELAKKTHLEAMKRACRLVWDEIEAEELIEDGWKSSPADFLSAEKDPRVPKGVEAKRAALQKRLSVKEELHSLRLRLAELEALDAALPPDREPPMPTGKLHLPPPKRGRPTAQPHV